MLTDNDVIWVVGQLGLNDVTWGQANNTDMALGSTKAKGREPKSCLGRVFQFKLVSFTDNTRIVQHANGHIES